MQPFGILGLTLIACHSQEGGIRLLRKAEIPVCFQVEKYGAATAIAPMETIAKRPGHEPIR
jgi:hypothetical protein